MSERSRRLPEHSQTASSLLEQFQQRLTTLPEFRQAITEKYFAQPVNTTPKEIDTVISKFFAKDPQESISSKNFFPGVSFKKDGAEYSVIYTSQARQLTMLKKEDDSSLIINLGVGKNNKDVAWYSENPKSIIPGEKAIQKAHELLTSLSPIP